MKKTGEIKTLFKGDGNGVDSVDAPSISRMAEVEHFSNEQLDLRKIIYPSMSNINVLNIFRELRTQLMRAQKKKNFICLVSSICNEGGASFVATNLAAVFALDKTKTSVIIDANLYAPSLNQLVIGESSTGVTDYLSDSSLKIKDIVYATGVPRLRVIPIGGNVEAAAEYYSSEKMTDFVSELRARYADRYIFIDGPPVTSSSEARILADIADTVLLVVPHGRATPEQVSAAIDAVGAEKLAGLVYND